MKIAILGGTFNPIHIGHLSLAEDVCESLGYDKIIFVLANIPPHKKISKSVNVQHRIKMLELAVKKNIKFDLDLCEIEREGISYTIDTIRYLNEKYKNELDGKIGLIIGQENASEFKKWKEAEHLAKLVDIIIARRQDVSSEQKEECKNKPLGEYTGGFENSNYKKVCEEFEYDFVPMENIILPISSTDVRTRIATKSGWRYLVPNEVFEYILENRLYE